MPSVEGLRVVPVEALEAGRELLHGRLDDEVVVVRHQAERMELPVVPPDDHAEEPEEEVAVVVVAIDRDPPGAARGDVEVAVGEDVAWKSGHSEPLYAAQGEREHLWKKRHASDTRGRGRCGHGRGLSPDTAAGDVTLRAAAERPGEARRLFGPCPGTVPRHGWGRHGLGGHVRRSRCWGRSRSTVPA
jgi:hypothetical protein